MRGLSPATPYYRKNNLWVPGGGAPPDLVEDFSTYSSTANMLADPRGIYSVAEDVNTGQMALDVSTGYGASPQCMRYDFPDRSADVGACNTGRCGDYTIGRNITLPSPVTMQMWVEWVTKFTTNWTTVAPSAWSCCSAAAWKAFFGRTDVSRFQMVPGIFGSDYTLGFPGNEEPADLPMTWSMFDGAWHVHRIWYGLGSGVGGTSFLADGTFVNAYLNQTPTASQIYGLALGRNMNQGPTVLSSVYWGRIAFWSHDPGWGIP